MLGGGVVRDLGVQGLIEFFFAIAGVSERIRTPPPPQQSPLPQKGSIHARTPCKLVFTKIPQV